jgi:Spy/CpxP family protein refolding chaperone
MLSYITNNSIMNSSINNYPLHTRNTRKLFSGRLAKAFLLSGALFIGWAANAQSTTNNMSGSDSTRHAGMHRHWGNRGDSTAHKDGFHRGGPGANGGWQAFHQGNHRMGQGGWAHRGGFGRGHGFGGHGIRYTPEQRKQVMAINNDYRKQTADLFKKDNITLREYKAGLIALQKQKKSKLEALLTQQQKDQLAARKARSAENAQVMAAARMERLKLRLSLSDDQVAKLKAGQESLRARIKAIHENDDLLPQQKMEQLKDLASQREDNLKSVLTPEQLAKFQEMHKNRQGSSWGDGDRRFRGNDGK